MLGCCNPDCDFSSLRRSPKCIKYSFRTNLRNSFRPSSGVHGLDNPTRPWPPNHWLIRRNLSAHFHLHRRGGHRHDFTVSCLNATSSPLCSVHCRLGCAYCHARWPVLTPDIPPAFDFQPKRGAGADLWCGGQRRANYSANDQYSFSQLHTGGNYRR